MLESRGSPRHCSAQATISLITTDHAVSDKIINLSTTFCGATNFILTITSLQNLLVTSVIDDLRQQPFLYSETFHSFFQDSAFSRLD